MKKIIILILAIILLIGSIYPLRSAVMQTFGISVSKTPLKWSTVIDATNGDNPSGGLIATGVYVYDGATFKLLRGDLNGILANIKSVSVSNTLSDTYDNPANAINTGSFKMNYDDTTGKWVRERVKWFFTSCNNVNVTGPCSQLNISAHPMTKHTWTIVWTGGPSSAQVNFEGSIDGTNWFILDSSITTSSEMRHVVNKGVMYYRANVVTFSGGTNPAVTVKIASFRD